MNLLVNPPFYRFIGLEQDYVPLSLLSVGSYMKQQGEDVLIKNMEVGVNVEYEGYAARFDNYDLYLKCLEDPSHPIWVEFNNTLDEVKPDKVGITVLNVKYQSALKLIEICQHRGIEVIVGGSHVTIDPTAYPKGVSVNVGEYESCGNRLKDLDTLPFPDYDILLDKYSPNGYGHVMSSRGCPFMCTFCASKNIWGRKVTYKTVDRTLEEMRYIQDRFGTDYFTFWDETFTVNKKRIKEFCIKYDLSAKWRCDTRADSITDEMVRDMKAANCGQMSLGIECADNDTLKRIGKNETTDTFIRAAEILNKHGIEWKAYAIIGFPTDTEDIIFKSIEFIKSLKPFRITLSYFTPYKGTDLYDEVKAMGLINEGYNMSLFSHQSPHNYFCPNIPKQRYLEIKHLVAQEVDKYNQQALKIWK